MTAMLSSPVSTCLFLLFISSSSAAQHHRRHGHGALYPEAVNLASLSRGVSIWSNGTCGERGPETYCKLRGSGCSVCDSTRSDKRHPAEYALDGDSSTWWQSSTLHASHKYHYVTITIDLKQVYQVLYVRIRSGNSPRPANWFVERSLDGQAFMPWQYFAASDDLCWARYGIKPSPPHPHRLASDTEVICTSAYSKVTPVEGGEMHVSLSAGRPGANSTGKDWIEFTKARYIRFRFQRLGSSKQRHNHEMSKRYYYSIRDILVQGRCLCHGHAQACRFDSLTKKSVCECEHNTCGADCSWCCPKHHQLGWRQSTPSKPHQCAKCECHGHASECFYDPLVAAATLSIDTNGRFHGGGVCINCTKHTGGVNCQRCEEGWYRPLGVRPDASVPCLPCDCHSVGATGSCIRDDSEAHLGKIAGWCKCRDGYTGSKCDECSSGYRGFPNCEPCQCNSNGMQPGSSCDSNCLCKANVEGEKCDRCKEGYFFLDQDNSAGCSACYCSGVSNRCTEAHGFYLREISTMEGWLVTDITAELEVIPYQAEPGSNTLAVAYYQLSGVDSYYWLAPQPYRGNKLTSYGSTMTFSLSWDVMRGDTSGKPTIGPDLILIGENGLTIGYGETWHNQKSVSITVQLVEEGWYHVVEEDSDVARRGNTSPALRSRREHRGADVTRHQFLSVLASIKHVLVKAKFHTDQAEGSLESCMLETAERGKGGSSVGFLEECYCPQGYIGLSCEECDYGYARVEPDGSSLRQHAVCSKCNCHSHAPTCDPNTGQCTSCEHFTYGTECELCSPGYYGDATQGTKEDCMRCACPLLHHSNNFSPACEMDSTDYICTACAPGHTGRHCERCDEGYYGDPTELGSKCEPCDCGDGPCDPISGLCLSCHGNREGKRCERCKPQHYSPDPLNTICLPCTCDALGSESNECDEVTGYCTCKDSFTGRACDRCQTGFGNVSAGCVPCKCDAAGAISSLCDSVSGACLCQPGVTGNTCDECLPAHYAYSPSGCKRCNCHVDGSNRQECNFDSGQCDCKENVIGQMCDSCRGEYWGLTSGLGCELCNCDTLGSQDQNCDMETGQCRCKPGVGGLKCDRCMPLYYGFSSQGCFECEVCELEGHICDPDTGKCICPPYTSGPDCSLCVHNSWGFTPLKGCKACNCDQHGSLTQHCDASSGRCSCREGYTGAKCETCARGWYGYPRCMRCDCSLAGTHSQHCSNGICVCDDTGQCPCKSHVVGKQCNHCREGSFGLSREDVHGCTPCFCFGRSTNCTSAGLVWSQVHMSRSRTLTVRYDNDTSSFLTNTYPVNTQEICYINLAMPGMNGVLKKKAKHLNVTNHLRLIPDDEGDVELGVTYLWDSPVYWQLSKAFLGDKVLSYGGFLRFTVETEGGTTLMPQSVLSSYPLIQIQGNDKVVLEHYPIISSPSNYFQVRFQESLWKNKNNPESRVSRETLMIALQNLQHILIRASDSVDFQVARLRELTMDTAIENKGVPFPNAVGIELCDCPKSYNSTSCQDPSLGFFRERRPATSPTSTIIIELVGEATPCQCNGRSSHCNIETGHCIGCANNTGGKHCGECAEGFYGNAESVEGCKPCPCPSVTNNFASSCQVFPDEEPICVCKPGYSGFRCDSCSYGWFGYPKVEGGGGCKMCNCNPYGSVSDECHEEKGQCNCKVNITGRDCSQCLNPRQVLRDSRGCVDCDEECVKLILDSVDDLASYFDSSTRHIARGLMAPPWETLVMLESDTNDLKHQYNLKRKVTSGYYTLNEYLDNSSHHIKNLLNKGKKLMKKHDNMLEHVSNLEKESEAVKSMLEASNKEISMIMKRLSDYISNEGEEINISAMIIEAKQLLNTIRDRDLEPLKNQSNRALRTCTNILKELKYIVSETNEAEYLEKRLKQLNERNDHLMDIISNIDKTVELIKLKNRNYRNSTEDIQNMFSTIVGVQGSTEDLLNESRLLNKIAQVYIDEAQDNYDALLELKKILRNGQNVLKKRIDSIMIDKLKNEYVIPAKHHAAMLHNLSRGYDREFQADFGLVMQATKAYDEIIDTVVSAKEDAIKAKDAVDEAYMLVFPRDDESLAETVGIALNVSTALKALSENQINIIIDLEEQHDNSMAAVIKTTESLKLIDMERHTLSRQIDSLVQQTHAVKSSSEETIATSDEVMEVAEGIQDNVTYLVYNIQTKLKPELEQMALDNELNINAAEHIVNEAQGNVRKSNEMVSNLFQNMKKYNDFFHQWNSSVGSKLEELRDKITQARHMASSIPLSITSIGESGGGGSCVRTYTPTHLEPSTMTSIMLTYAISSHLRDALLFYLPSSSTEDFVAIEMVNRKMRFVWNVGGGLGEVIHPLHIQTAGDLSKDQHWYKVEAHRMSNVGRLWVRPVLLSIGSPLSNQPPATNSSAPGIGRLDVGPGDRVWVGGADRVRHPHLLSKHSGLVGCLHQLHLNDRPIGLWDFRTQNPFSCTACIQGAEEVKDETSYTFSGDGYVALHQDSTATYNKYLFSASFAFRTFDFNALLFLAVGADKERFISLSLSEGKVIFRIGYGNESILEMTTMKKYNTGNWTRVEASRYFDRTKKIEKGLLKVGEEVREGAPTPPPGQDSIPDLSSADYYLGGLPPGEVLPLGAPPALPFLGCMSHVQIAQDEYNLLKARYWGVQAACTDKPVSVAGFFGSGYLELGSHNLRKGGGFSFVFSTSDRDTLLLLSTFQGQKGSDGDVSNHIEQEEHQLSYYSVSLRRGQLDVRLNGGRGEVRLASMSSEYADSKFHSIAVTKNGRRVELRVDDVLDAATTLPEGSNVIRSPGAKGGLYLGGVPKSFNTTASTYSSQPLVGTIKDLIINNKVIGMEQPISFEEVAIGRFGPESRDDHSANPSRGATACRKVSSYSLEPGAVKFGDSSNSHVQINLRKRSLLQKNFSLELNFRTFYPNGLLFIVPGVKGKQPHYLMASLRSGRVSIAVKGKRKIETTGQVVFNDGAWHHMVLQRQDRKMMLKVDSVDPGKTKTPKKMNLGSSLFIGGVPETGVALPPQLLYKLEGFKGCIRDLKLNTKTEDLVGDKSTPHRIGQCFPQVERGSFFPGDAFAVYNNKFDVGELVELELEFRTSELNGILLSISEPDGYPSLTLELHNGKMVLGGDNGDRRPYKVELSLASEFTVCDNRWHRVQALYIGDEITLRVDTVDTKYWLSDNGHLTEAHTNSPLYIGGLPEYAPSSTLMLRENFRGCIRGVMINGERRDWIDMSALHNILLSSCPLTN